jgi:hypothetical protein
MAPKAFSAAMSVGYCEQHTSGAIGVFDPPDSILVRHG